MTSTARISPHRPLRLLAATLTLALGAALVQPASAQPHGGPDMMMGGPHIERMLDGVNATADQRSQIKTIMDAARADLKGQREEGRKLREQTMQLFSQPTVDARAAEQLRVQMLAQHDQASKRMLQAMLDVSRVLTPEQRQKIAERMAQRPGQRPAR